MHDGSMQAPLSARDGDLAHVLQALERGATLLVPHVRAARKWAAAYDTMQRQSGKSWLAARILPWGAWTSSLWDQALLQGADHRVRLNRLQEQELWSRIIRRASTEALSPVAQQAQLCVSALDLLGKYDTSGAFDTFLQLNSAASADVVTFRGWYAEFEALCAEEGLLPASHVEQELARLIGAGKLPVRGEYLASCLDQLTPAQKVLLAAVSDNGGKVTHLPSPAVRRSAPELLRCDSLQSEMEQCAGWVRAQLEVDATTSLAIVVPGLAASAANLERELRSVVASDTLDVTRRDVEAPFEFSNGRPLTNFRLKMQAPCCGAGTFP